MQKAFLGTKCQKKVTVEERVKNIYYHIPMLFVQNYQLKRFEKKKVLCNK